MPSASTLALFALASFALVVIPGPSVFYILGHAVERGTRTGVVAALGIEAGTLVHGFAAAVGVSALLVSSATAFTLVKVAGAVYLIYLGVRELTSRAAPPDPEAPLPPARSLRKVWGQGVLVNALNPKTAVFALAFFPQFVDPNAGPVALQVIALALTLSLVGFVSDMGWVVLGGAAGRRMKERAKRRLQMTSGGVLLAFGIGTAVSAARRVN